MVRTRVWGLGLAVSAHEIQNGAWVIAVKTFLVSFLAGVMGGLGIFALPWARSRWGDGVLFWTCTALTLYGMWQVFLGWRDLRAPQPPASRQTEPNG